MQEDEQLLAAGGVMNKRAGCLLLPFLPVKSAGSLFITTKRIIFEPILFYKLLTRKMAFGLEDVAEASSTGSSVELDILDFVNIGKALTIKLKSGKSVTFRSMQADPLADAINDAVQRFGRGAGDSVPS